MKLCGTPKDHCSGAFTQASKGLGQSCKVHMSSEEAFACYRRYLIRKQGYTQVGARAFSPPDGGPVRILDKKSRFGGNLRSGKGEKQARVMPKHRSGGIIY